MPVRAAKFGSAQDNETVRQAIVNLSATRNPTTNAIGEAELIAEVERLMLFNVRVERHQKAVRMVRAAERPGKTPSEGQLVLPGFDPKPWEPDRLMPDNNGKTVEQNRATAHFVSEALQRRRVNLQRAQDAYNFAQAEYDEYDEWAYEQGIIGRHANQITLGNFVRERGYWMPEPLPGDGDTDDDD